MIRAERRAHRLWLIVLALVALAGCSVLGGQPPTPAPLPAATATLSASAPTPSDTPAPTLTPSATPAPSATPTPTLSPTPSITPLPTLPPPTATATFAPITADERSAIFEQVWGLVAKRYLYPDYRGVDWAALRAEYAPQVAAAASPEQFYGLMQAMIVRLGDDHTRYETPQEVAEDEARAAGELSYAGIGVTIRDDPAGALITRIARGGPADQAGLRPRDLITAIGSIPITDTAAFGLAGPEGAVRGAPGTVVQLTVRSPSEPARELRITRQVIPSDAFPPVEALRIGDTGVGLLLIDTFARADLASLVRAQIEQLQAAGPLTGLIIDVRSNSGGFIDEMLDTLAIFIDGGAIGSSGGRRSQESLEIAGGQVLPGLADLPLAVLISDNTVSAAEMFAAGMRVRQRAPLVGSTSAGNTENLVPHNLADGSRLWLAEYAYRLPDGSLIEEVGVRPDHEVAAEWWRFAPEDDPQIQAALKALGTE